MNTSAKKYLKAVINLIVAAIIVFAAAAGAGVFHALCHRLDYCLDSGAACQLF